MSALYYEVTGAEVLAFCQDYRRRRTAARTINLEWAKAKGAQAVVTGFGGGVAGLTFERDVAPKGWVKARGRTRDGRVLFHPGKRTEDGKALTKEMNALPRDPDPDEFAERFGVPRSLSYRKSAECYGTERLNAIFPDTVFIAWTDPGDSFFVLLPDIAGRIAAKVADGYICEPASFTPPDGLKLSSRARYDLAVATSAVAKEEAEAA